MRTPWLLLVVLVGCIGGRDEHGDEGLEGNGQTFPTANANVALLGGFDRLFDRTASRCVEKLPATETAPWTSGAFEPTFALDYVSSREQLAEELGVDLGLKVQHLVGSAELGLQLTRQFRRSTRSVSLLLKARQEYSVVNHADLALSDWALQLLKTDLDAFVNRCGTHFVHGIRYAGELVVLITFNANDEESLSGLTSSLGIRAGSRMTPFQVSGDLKVRLSQFAKQEGISVTVQVAGRGFSLSDGTHASDGLIQHIVGSELNAETWTRLDAVRQNLNRSVAMDACRDAGEPECDGPGYDANRFRAAQPTGVELGQYEALYGALGEAEVPLSYVHAQRDRVEEYVRALAGLQEQMEKHFAYDLAPFLEAGAGARAAYNVVPPGLPAFTLQGLTDTANHWADELRPQAGAQVGRQIQALIDTELACWNAASRDVDHQCVPAGLGAADTPAYRAFQEALLEYRSTARISPLRFRVGPGSLTFDEAQAFCNEQRDADGARMRLPRRHETPLLAVLVGYGDVNSTDPTTAGRNRIWVDGGGEPCSPEQRTWTYFSVPETDRHDGLTCGGLTERLPLVCVPQAGPDPLLPLQ